MLFSTEQKQIKMLTGTTSVSKNTVIITYGLLGVCWHLDIKTNFFLVNFLFVHCNDKKDTVERTLYRRKQFSTTIFSDYEKKLKEIIF